MQSGACASKSDREIPAHLRAALAPVARKVFWWGDPFEWLQDRIRFVAQVMTFGDLSDTAQVAELLGEEAFLEVLEDAPPGVFDVKSWNYWHLRYGKQVPPLPARKL